jgi:hypothetical protein
MQKIDHPLINLRRRLGVGASLRQPDSIKYEYLRINERILDICRLRIRDLVHGLV